jgi:arylsulfatase A-like enzyme
MFVCDTLRADHLGCYGYFRDTTPNIDRLAREGVRFERFYAAGVPTGLSFTSLHTGLHPIRHGVYNYCPPELILDDAPTLAESLRAGGYTTAAFDNLAFNRGWCRDPVHFYRGFEHYITDVSNPRDWDALGEAVRAEWYTSRLIRWIESHGDEPFFAFVHPWDPHQPYTQPAPFRSFFRHRPGDREDLEIREAAADYRYVPGWGEIGQIYEDHGVYPGMESAVDVPCREASIDLYDGAVRYMDQCIGHVVEFLDRRGILDETLVVVTGDHGELLGQHGIYSHMTAYEPNVRLPLILRFPERLAGGVAVGGLASNVDLMPTLLELSDNECPANVDGSSILPLLDGADVHDRIVCDEGCGVRCLITEHWKLIRYYDDDSVELFHIGDDPMEIVDLSRSNSVQRHQLEADLESWAKKNPDDPIRRAAANFDRKALYEKIGMPNYMTPAS